MYRIKANTEYTDPVFDIGLTTNYEISIQASPDGFSFCIANPDNYHVLYIKEYVFVEELPMDDIAALFSEINYWDDLLRLPYRQIKLMYASQRQTFVPDALYSAQNASALLDALFMPSRLLENIVVNRVQTLDTWCISSVPAPLYSALNNHQPSATWFSSSVPICERMVSERYTGGQTQVIINKHRQFFDLFITENGRLTLNNQYKILNHFDLGYFVVNAVDQLNIDADRLVVRLMGDINQHSEDVQFLKKYFPNVALERNHSIFHGRVVDKIPLYRYINLMNLHLCV
jgi:hemin uptake protein HemP